MAALVIGAVGSALFIGNNLPIHSGPVKLRMMTREGPLAKPRFNEPFYTGPSVFAGTNLDDLGAKLAASGVFDGCMYGASGTCWSDVRASNSLFVAAPLWPASECPLLGPSWWAELSDHKLVVTIDHGPGSACMGSSSQFALFAVNLGALPAGKLVVEVDYVTGSHTNQMHHVLDTSTNVNVPWHLGFP
jgi:hypothetical protein